ncbi:hypothetical protein F5J12DRAFT_96508 [Pisolithus orientalis]|uniref:uncharacterized protein n=1 Tax=Pisolithus orientalis TaxID=936130 RepID=UPI002224F88A|nr:uncharacterized protein F5J12DRAFT_96508 [Pisolithus orientalis]KAI6006510.1 hypothetical protein F5J12DRAFT_96508 [Pisolithus orientalis]
MATIAIVVVSSVRVWHRFVALFHHNRPMLIKKKRRLSYCTSMYPTIFTEMMTSAYRFTDNTFSSASQITLYSGLPFSATFLLAEVLITVSLCVLLYDSRSRSAFPRSKRLLTTLIIYAVNQGLLSLLVALIEFLATVTSQGTWLTGLDFIIPRLYANSLLASLNTRQYLRSQNSGTRSGERINTVHFMNLQKHSEGLERSNDGDKHIEAIVIDITADSALNKTTSFRSEGEAQF